MASDKNDKNDDKKAGSGGSGESSEHEGGEKKRSLMQFLVDDMEHVLQTSLTDPSNHIPYVDVFSTDDYFYIDMAVPGVNEEDIEVVFFKNSIKVSATKHQCGAQEELNYICMERSFGKIYRVVEIPFPINTTKIEAHYDHGVLSISMPRVEEKRGRPIKIDINKD